MKALVTGATGFIGMKLIKSLEDCGYSIRILSRNNNLDYDTAICDLQNETIPESALDSVDVIFHLAAHAHDLASDSIQEKIYYDVNLGGTVKLIKIAVKKKVRKFIYVSSVKAGGIPSFGVCASENDQGEPEGIYGKTKREAELKLLKIGEESNIFLSIIRPSLVYGPNVKGNLQLMLSGIKKGWFLPLPETNNKISMIHVDDLVRAILLVADDGRANGEIFIATDCTPNSSREIYNSMCSALGKPIPKWSVPKIFFDMASLINPRIRYKLNKLLGDKCYSSSKLESLGFKAKKSLKDMNETDY
jgi:UDP-glucose 4-epimerase